MLVLIFHQTSWKENIYGYGQLRAVQTALTLEKIFSDQIDSRSLLSHLLGLPSLQINQCCSTQEHFHSGQSSDKQRSAGPVSTNPAQSGGNVLGMMYRITPQLLPEGGAVADEKLFSSQGETWRRISVHSIRLSTGR